MARWLQQAPDAPSRAEKDFTPDRVTDLLVFYGRTLPDGALTSDALVAQWIASANAQLATADRDVLAAALRHAVGFGSEPAATAVPPAPARRSVLLASDRDGLEAALRRAGISVIRVAFTPFDEAAAAQVRHFDTYNRTAASQRVADIVEAARKTPPSVLVADGDAALAGALAAAIVPIRRSILDVSAFDLDSDATYLEHLYIPGIRRAGGVMKAMAMARGEVVLHGLASPPLTISEIVALARK
jgi:hypothetical protein